MSAKKVYSLKDTSSEIVAVIKYRNVCSLADLRTEVERYDLLDYPFQFISEVGYPVNPKQEYSWDVEETVIGVKRKFIELGEEHMNREIKKKIGQTDSDTNKLPHEVMQETISSEGSTTHANTNDHPDSIKAQSLIEDSIKAQSLIEDSVKAQSLIESKLRDLWNSKLLELQKTLPTESMSLQFSLEGDKPMIKIHCDGCNVDYGSGDILKAVATIRNFRRSHITSRRHSKRNFYTSDQNLAGEKDMHDVKERHEPSDHHKILHAINIFDEFSKKEIDSPFKVVESTIGDYTDKTTVKVECTICNKWFALIPKTGNIVASLSEHIKSKSHNENSVRQTMIRTGSVGRPKKASNDGR